MRIGKSRVLVLVGLLLIIGLLSLDRDILSYDTLGYFAEQPRRLLWVAAIAIGSGLVALAMHRLVIPTLKRPSVAEWLRPILLIFMAVIGFLVFYVLSLGPVFRLCEPSPLTGWRSLPSVVQFIYSPLRQVAQADARVARVLDDYVQLWVGVR